MENNAKAEKLQQYISDKHKKHLTEVFKTFYLYNYFTTISTHISAHLYTHLDFNIYLRCILHNFVFPVIPISMLHQSISHLLNIQLLMFLSLTISFAYHLLIGIQSYRMDFQNKISKLSKSSNYVSKLPIDNRIKELVIQDLKYKAENQE